MYAKSSEQHLLAVVAGRRAATLAGASLVHLLEADEGQLARLGLSPMARRRLLACAEMARRYQPKSPEQERVTTARDALAHLECLRRQPREQLAVLLLDARLHPCGFEIVAAGGLVQVSAGAPDVLRPAVVARATAIVIAHNHPSGAVEPSREDTAFTAAMVAAGRTLGVEVVDHIIVGPRAYYSFREAGLL